MKGIVSNEPGPWAARLMIAAALLLLVTITLVLGSANTLDETLTAIAAVLALIAVSAVLCAIVGERVVRDRRHGR